MRKLGRPTDQRLAMLKTLTTDLFLHGKITTTEDRAQEFKDIADSIVYLALKEKDNFELVDQKVIKAKIDANGRKVTEKAVSKNGKEYNKVVKVETTEKREKDLPSRLHARRQIMKKVNKVKGTDVIAKIFGEIAKNQEGRVGGYTRIVKLNPRRGDNAKMAVLEIL